jgi:hypothetical protein
MSTPEPLSVEMPSPRHGVLARVRWKKIAEIRETCITRRRQEQEALGVFG